MNHVRLVALLLLLPACARADDDPAKLTPAEAFTKAETSYREGDLLAAEKLYRRAREGDDLPQQRRSTDRLLIVYTRLGRPDQALELGQEYRRRLVELKDARRLREFAYQLGDAWLSLGHYPEAKKELTDSLEEQPADAALPPLLQLDAWWLLGGVADANHEREQATKCWRKVESLALNLLDKNDNLTTGERTECVWKLTDAYRELGQPALALGHLKTLLELHGKTDTKDKRDTLFRIAGHRNALAEYAESETALRAALKIHRDVDADNPLMEGDLLQLLGDVREKRDDLADAEKVREEAAKKYLEVLKGGERRTARAALAFWRLETLYQKSSQYRRAVELTELQADHWTRDTLVHGRLIAEQGTLKVLLGAYKQAHEPLKEALARLDKEQPVNLIELPRVLNNLATVEQALNNLDESNKYAERALKLYRDRRLPDDVTLAETYNVLGTTLALRGQYAQAIDAFRAGIACCVKLGPVADPQHSHLLLHVALLHKAQGDLALALPTCQKAYDLYCKFAHRDVFGHACFQAALATMEVAQGKYGAAAGRADRILELCRRYEIEGGVLVVTARHAQALDRLDRRDLTDARKLWQQTLALQEKEGELLVRPRTLNYLALCCEMEGKAADAEKLYRQAIDIQAKNPRALPGVHFISLWRLANILDRAGKHDEGRQLLARGLDVVEAARLRLYGDAKQRSAFFAQFTIGFEELVDRCVRDGKLEEALQYALRGRSRTYLDQLQLCGVDPRESLAGDNGTKLRQQEADLARRLAAIRAQAQFMPEPNPKEIEHLARDLEETQGKYAEVWREILNASPLYRSLALDAGAGKALQTIRQKALNARTALVWYWIGVERSYVFLVRAEGDVEVFPLTAPADLADTVARLAQANELGGQVPRRGVVYTPKAKRADDGPPGKPATSVFLNAGQTRQLVEVYRNNLRPGYTPTRGIILTTRKSAKQETTGVAVIGEAFMPAALRKRLVALKPDQVVVVPDDALHKLPLEALVLQKGDKTCYVLDELPPLIYVPSAAALAFLVDRQAPKGSAAATLLTVANPKYPQPPKDGADDPDVEVPVVLGLKGQLPLLKQTQRESDRIAGLFAKDTKEVLTGEGATESRVAAAMRGKGYVHLAVHGFADDRLGNMFGALALMPPEKKGADEDGFLSLHEIYRLPLGDCELAVLSACQTNVGPQQPLEAGITLAGAFLAAGARRVVASHWSVADDSAAELIGTLFEETIKGEKLPPAQALRKAQRKLRESEKWSAPYHWAPFVLVGPP